MALIREGQLVPDSWIKLDDDAALPAVGDIIVSLDRWRRCRERNHRQADWARRVPLHGSRFRQLCARLPDGSRSIVSGCPGWPRPQVLTRARSLVDAYGADDSPGCVLETTCLNQFEESFGVLRCQTHRTASGLRQRVHGDVAPQLPTNKQLAANCAFRSQRPGARSDFFGIGLSGFCQISVSGRDAYPRRPAIVSVNLLAHSELEISGEADPDFGKCVLLAGDRNTAA